MPDSLAYDLHAVTSRLDRLADRILAAETGTSYSRFLALYYISLGADTQRALADWLGVTEPSVSRTVANLADAGLVSLGTHPEGGNRRMLRLTPAGVGTVEHCGGLLNARFAALLAITDIDAAAYATSTRRLLRAIADQELRLPAMAPGVSPSTGD
jgi:DNA-binding MarR family transcriptional regulator